MTFAFLPRPRWLRGAAAAALALLTACANFGLPKWTPGMTRDQATLGMGRPTAEYPLADGGQRIEFATGPMGHKTWMLDFDNAGSLQRWEQVLDEQHFMAIRPGMSEQEVLMRLGTPSNRGAIPRQHQKVWSYRYETLFCQWYQLGIDDRSGQVVDAIYSPDPQCDHRDPDRP